MKGLIYIQNHTNFNDPKHNVSMIIIRIPIPSSSFQLSLELFLVTILMQIFYTFGNSGKNSKLILTLPFCFLITLSWQTPAFPSLHSPPTLRYQSNQHTAQLHPLTTRERLTVGQVSPSLLNGEVGPRWRSVQQELVISVKTSLFLQKT